MTEAVDTYSEKFRRECEARTWLRQGYSTAASINELMVRIVAKRGQRAADELREEMRRQWRLMKGSGHG